MIERSRIQSFANAIARELKAERIILFGSHCRGTAGPDSDVDLLVIMPDDGKAAHAHAAEIFAKMHPGFPIDLLIRTRAEFERRLRLRDWLMRDIERDGEVLYASDSYSRHSSSSDLTEDML